MLGDVDQQFYKAVKRYRWVWQYVLLVAIFFIAYAWTSNAHKLQNQRILKYENQWLTLTGEIVGTPIKFSYGYITTLRATQVSRTPIKGLVTLHWYGHSLPVVKAGQYWRLPVKVLRAHSLNNWRIRSVSKAPRVYAQVIKNPVVYGLQHPVLLQDSIDGMNYFREDLAQFIRNTLNNDQAVAFFQALCLGDRTHMDHALSRLFLKTGTSHLMAISGLHIGLVALVCFTIFFHLLVKIPWRYISRHQVALVLAFICAYFYAHLTGLAMTTERALVMLFGLVVANFLYRTLSLWSALYLSIVFLALFHPLSVFSPSVVLSIVAVFYIGCLVSYRVKKGRGMLDAFKLQCMLSVLLLPVVSYFFSYVSLVEILANIFAVPWVEMVLAPLALLSCIIHVFSPLLASYLLKCAAFLLKPLLWYLSLLSSLSFSIWVHPVSHAYVVGMCILGFLMVYMRLNKPMMIAGLVMCLPWFFSATHARPKQGMVLTVLDVGQGLSCLLQTAHHQMVYDTGARYASGFDLGERVVVPSLMDRGVSHLDALMISHGDMDHRGGAPAVLDFYPTQVSTSAPWYFHHAHTCQRGDHWDWDGVHFEVLSPESGAPYKGNTSSCVLRVWSDKWQVLLTGDIDFKAEHQLLKNSRSKLASTVLVAPHHGSCHGSSPGFIEAVAPEKVIVSSGYHNRYHMPCERVIKLYHQLHARVYNTAEKGEVDIHLP